jgi:hypothetical protein
MQFISGFDENKQVRLRRGKWRQKSPSKTRANMLHVAYDDGLTVEGLTGCVVVCVFPCVVPPVVETLPEAVLEADVAVEEPWLAVEIAAVTYDGAGAAMAWVMAALWLGAAAIAAWDMAPDCVGAAVTAACAMAPAREGSAVTAAVVMVAA